MGLPCGFWARNFFDQRRMFTEYIRTNVERVDWGFVQFILERRLGKHLMQMPELERFDIDETRNCKRKNTTIVYPGPEKKGRVCDDDDDDMYESERNKHCKRDRTDVDLSDNVTTNKRR